MLRKRLKGELEKDKPIRCRRTLKGIIREIKEWEKVLQEHIKDTKKCPHCGGKLE
jgi:DNA-directed RNA polymerase subunit RPC12/RpoP